MKPNEVQTATAPTAKYAVPFGTAKDCKFSLPERSKETPKIQKDGKTIIYLKPLVEIMIPVLARDGSLTDVVLNATLWRERQDTPDGEQQSFGFSIPRPLVHSYLNYTPKS